MNLCLLNIFIPQNTQFGVLLLLDDENTTEDICVLNCVIFMVKNECSPYCYAQGFLVNK